MKKHEEEITVLEKTFDELATRVSAFSGDDLNFFSDERTYTRAADRVRAVALIAAHEYRKRGESAPPHVASAMFFMPAEPGTESLNSIADSITDERRDVLTKAPSRKQHSVTHYEKSFDTKSDSITQLLKKWSKGDEKALDQLMPLVYDELHRLAEGYLRRERREHTLQPTALVNDLFLKFFDQNSSSWQNRAQFFRVAALTMRRILVDHARAHQSVKRGGESLAVPLKDVPAFGAQPDADLLALHDVLKQLEELDPVQGQIVELRFFGGLTIGETADVMQISHATVEREWRTARLFLKRELTVKRQLIQEMATIDGAQEGGSVGEIAVAGPIVSISASTSFSLSLEL